MDKEEVKLFLINQIFISALWACLIVSIIFMFKTANLFAIPLIVIGGILSTFPCLLFFIYPFCRTLYIKEISYMPYWLIGITIITYIYGYLIGISFGVKNLAFQGNVYGGTGLIMAFFIWMRIFNKTNTTNKFSNKEKL